jgi:hypothetical protein
MPVSSVEALRVARAEAEYADVRKSRSVAYALWAHRIVESTVASARAADPYRAA